MRERSNRIVHPARAPRANVEFHLHVRCRLETLPFALDATTRILMSCGDTSALWCERRKFLFDLETTLSGD